MPKDLGDAEKTENEEGKEGMPRKERAGQGTVRAGIGKSKG